MTQDQNITIRINLILRQNIRRDKNESHNDKDTFVPRWYK